MFQNYPNPFNPKTKIRFAVPKSTFTSLVVYDILGKKTAELVNEVLVAGVYQFEWSAEEFSSGVYFYRLTTDQFADTKKMILVK